MFKGLARAAAFPFVLIFSLSSPVHSDQMVSSHAAEEAVNFFVDMGYSKVELNKCILTLSRDILSRSENNGYYKYTRRIHIDTLDWASDPMWVVVVDKPKVYYRVLIEYKDSYYNKYRDALLFQVWSRREYPLSHWPYENPIFNDEYTSILERDLYMIIRDVDDMNIWTDYSFNGPSTRFPSNFDLSFSNEKMLRDTIIALKQYSKETSCN